MLAKRKGLDRSLSSLVVFIYAGETEMSPEKGGRVQTPLKKETHPDPLHHEADVANVLELGALIDGVDGLHVTGDLKRQHTDSSFHAPHV